MSDYISLLGRKLLDRRNLLKQTTGVMGGLALSDFLFRDGFSDTDSVDNFSSKKCL